MKRITRTSFGFTLIEMVIVITVTAILALFLAGAIEKGVESWYFVADRSDLMTQTPYALNRMARELRYIKDSKSVYAAASNTITFTDANNNSITFSLSGNTIYRNNDILLDGVAAFSLQYSDANGNIIVAPLVNPAKTDIRKIKIFIRTQKGSNPLDMETTLKPRNF